MYLKIKDNKLDIVIVKGFLNNFKGFMFKRNINYGLLFKTSSIHTFFMKEDIDVIQLDKEYNVIRYFISLKKNKIILPKKNIYYTLELPKNTINKLNIKLNKKIEINYELVKKK